MAIKTIETKAVISAQDQTGATFAAVAEKLKAMEGTAKRASEIAGQAGGKFGGMAPKIAGVAKSIDALGVAIGGLATIGVEKLARLAEKVVDVGLEMDKLTRRQRALFHITEKQQAPLLAQAERLGTTTPYKAPEIIGGQNVLAGRGYSQEQTVPVVEEAAKLATALDMPIAEAVGNLASAIFDEGERINGSAAEIRKKAERASNEIAQASQLSGMTAADIQSLRKGGALETAGMSLPFLISQAAALRKAGVEDPAQAIKMFASAFNKRTPEALSTFHALGLNYDDYVKPGKGMRAGDLNEEFKRQFIDDEGKHFGLKPSALKEVQRILNDPKIAGNKDKLTSAINAAVNADSSPAFTKKVTKAIDKFWDASVGGFDTERAWRDVLARHASTPQAESLFGKRQGILWGGLGTNLSLDDQKKTERAMNNIPGDFTGREAEEIMGGPAGAALKAKGAIEAAEARAAKDLEGGTTAFFNTVSDLANSFRDATPEVRALGEAAAGAALLWSGYGAAKFVSGLFGGAAAGAAAGEVGAGLAGTAAVGGLGLGVGLGGLAALGGYEFLSHVPPAEGGESYGLDHPGWHPGMRKESALNAMPSVSFRAPSGGGAQMPGALQGQATIKNSLAITLDPGLVAKEIRNQLDAGGNLRADTGVSMPASALPR